MALTTTAANFTPTRSSSANAVSMSSLTGVVSGSVTSTHWANAGSDNSAATSAACCRMAPTLTDSINPCAL